MSRSMWPVVWETLVVLPALVVAVGVVAGGARRLEGLARGMAIAAGIALALYALQGLLRTGLVTASFVEVPLPVVFAWSLAALPLYAITVLLFLGAALAPRGAG